MMEEGAVEAAHLSYYPFLAAATSYVEASGITLDELVSRAALERARVRGKERVREAIRAGAIRKPTLMSRAQADIELLSYPFARILVSCINNAHLIRRFALAEAKSAYMTLKEDSAFGGGDTDLLFEMAREFELHIELAGMPHEHAPVRIPFVEYLRYTANLRDKRWKLVNRALNKGQVNLRTNEFLRMLQEAIHARIRKDLPLDVPPAVCESVRRYMKELEAELEAWRKKFAEDELETGMRVKDPASFPPCIRAILSNLREGVNVPHTARFAVTSFLLNVGLTVDEIIELYQSSPDFDEERTRYQVVHISGEMGSTRYTAPSCSTMRTYGNCVDRDDVCEKIGHPLSYYKMKLKLKRQSERQKRVSVKDTGLDEGRSQDEE
ncbi:MAG TPA: DNA primase regulatory subunit PriL [Methanomicrobia archaeon]|nr:DNA primase regulatory subunit PriL [Methanomicrobia archaeon]